MLARYVSGECYTGCVKHILLIGGTGHLGQVVLSELLKNKYSVTALVRNPQKLSLKDKNLSIITGEVTKREDLEKALSGIDIVISTLGHGIRTPFPIQKKTLEVLIPLMEKKKIMRFITITGAGLLVKGDPKSLLAEIGEKAFHIIDPYRLDDASDQQKLVEKSTLDWTVVRTPVHSGSGPEKVSHVGFAQPAIWKTVSRKAIANFMIECIEKNSYIKQSPIIY